MDKLVLFDIDKTLVDLTSLHTEAYKNMFKQLFNINATYTDLQVEDYAGKTTNDIIRKVLNKHGFDNPTIEVRLPEASSTLDQKLIDQIEHSKSRAGKEYVLKGAEELLKSIKRSEDFYLASYTGNLARTAEAILNFTGLNKYFPVKSFGDDATVRNRTDLITLAKERAEIFYKRKFEPADIYVFGDSIYDIRSANELGFVSVCVATGMYSAECLAKEKPTFALESLEDTKHIFELVFKHLFVG
jgi:phosphoglycolate phosphatase-like HAD superfamily hydrolase